MNIPVHVISPARAADRRESITALLNADGGDSAHPFVAHAAEQKTKRATST